MPDDLAGGFQSVDAASDFAVFSSCLTLIDSLPFFAECKRESYDLLVATPGRRILEVGCGLGDDAVSLARFVAPDGTVVAIDGSQTMIRAAQSAQRLGLARLHRPSDYPAWLCPTRKRSRPRGQIGGVWREHLKI
jgi:SAM-dependent methyltransferase